MFPDSRRILVLVGTIASGKSTFTRRRAMSGNYLVVNDDAIVQAVHGGDYRLYDKKLKPLYKGVENQIAVTAIGLGYSVVVDRGVNLSIDSRRRWIGLGHSLDVPVEAVVFPFESAEAHAKRRAEKDGRGHGGAYWFEVARSHIGRYEPPTLAEGFRAISEVRRTEDGDFVVLSEVERIAG